MNVIHITNILSFCSEKALKKKHGNDFNTAINIAENKTDPNYTAKNQRKIQQIIDAIEKSSFESVDTGIDDT